MSVLKITDVSKIFPNGTKAVDRFSLDVADGELVCLLGPSGSGKSTLLRMVGGFETPSSGQMTIDGDDITRLPPEKRPTGMVFQSHALWTHMNVFKNLAFGLKLRKVPAAEIKRRVEGVLELVGLGGYGNRAVTQLSGGQQQRVALARSLVLEPKILLLDEPFASLDQHLRERLREEVRDIQQRLKITTLFVTHGQDEALSMADRIVVMNHGVIEQVGTPQEIYQQPATRFVAEFVGSMNFIGASVATDSQLRIAESLIQAPVLENRNLVRGDRFDLAIRPENIRFSEEVKDALPVRIRTYEFLGSFCRYECELQHDKLAASIFVDVSGEQAQNMKLRVGDIRYIQFAERGARAYPALSQSGDKAIAA